MPKPRTKRKTTWSEAARQAAVRQFEMTLKVSTERPTIFQHYVKIAQANPYQAKHPHAARAYRAEARALVEKHHGTNLPDGRHYRLRYWKPGLRPLDERQVMPACRTWAKARGILTPTPTR